MKSLLLVLLLFSAAAAQQPDSMVAVVLAREGCVADHQVDPWACSEVVIMKQSEAKAKFTDLRAKENLTGSESQLYAALVIALGTVPGSTAVDTSCLSPQELEHQRWQRQPAQAPAPCSEKH